ncbi:hypothetical protein AB0L54_33015 [Streptomyces sp. NPDC052196]|uniref:hypothetical protein n=1 Tax=Streptomyces sp. NPDC052196 TaxID=3156691 RepID=UPI00343AAA38
MNLAPACDFCSRPGAVVFFNVTEYRVRLPTHDWYSGDRFYACPSCRTYVDASDWAGLIRYADLGPLGTQVVAGFRDNHTPGAISFEPGTNPEANR